MSTYVPSRNDGVVVAENAAVKVVNRVHPTFDSFDTRRDVIDHVRRLIKRRFNGCEVFPYGSVPLRTFLPDGDIDLTVLTGPNAPESLPRDVFAVLENEERNTCARYKVRDTNFIDAEVKLVKCVVRDIEIDISFNQLGGLATLCFFDQVDRFIGKNHLFKRSITLVKTWCFYESHILGSFHGLISTYGMEVLVLYVFQLYHSSLNGPLEVLHRFLSYYSTFDWDRYGISLKGPVFIKSHPRLAVEFPEGETFHLMLSQEHLDYCTEMFSIPSDEAEAKAKVFPVKLLNIVDPLKPNNNLGRSVNRANFLRIRSAFKFGARKIAQLLQAPWDKIAEEISKFFCNTLAICEHQYCPGFRYLALDHGEEASCGGSLLAHEEDDIYLDLVDLEGDYDGHLRNWIYCQLNYGTASTLVQAHIPNPPPPPPQPLASSSMIQNPNHSWDYGHHHSLPHYTYHDTSYNHDLRPTSQGLGTYFPQIVQSDYDRARSAHGRGFSPRYNLYVRGNNDSRYHSYRASNSYRRGRPQQRRPSSSHSFGRGNPGQEFAGGQCRVRIGSVGNLVREMIQSSEGSANIPSPVLMREQER